MKLNHNHLRKIPSGQYWECDILPNYNWHRHELRLSMQSSSSWMLSCSPKQQGADLIRRLESVPSTRDFRNHPLHKIYVILWMKSPFIEVEGNFLWNFIWAHNLTKTQVIGSQTALIHPTTGLKRTKSRIGSKIMVTNYLRKLYHICAHRKIIRITWGWRDCVIKARK